MEYGYHPQIIDLYVGMVETHNIGKAILEQRSITSPEIC